MYKLDEILESVKKNKGAIGKGLAVIGAGLVLSTLLPEAVDAEALPGRNSRFLRNQNTGFSGTRFTRHRGNTGRRPGRSSNVRSSIYNVNFEDFYGTVINNYDGRNGTQVEIAYGDITIGWTIQGENDERLGRMILFDIMYELGRYKFAGKMDDQCSRKMFLNGEQVSLNWRYFSPRSGLYLNPMSIDTLDQKLDRAFYLMGSDIVYEIKGWVFGIDYIGDNLFDDVVENHINFYNDINLSNKVVEQRILRSKTPDLRRYLKDCLIAAQNKAFSDVETGAASFYTKPLSAPTATIAGTQVALFDYTLNDEMRLKREAARKLPKGTTKEEIRMVAYNKLLDEMVAKIKAVNPNSKITKSHLDNLVRISGGNVYTKEDGPIELPATMETYRLIREAALKKQRAKTQASSFSAQQKQ